MPITTIVEFFWGNKTVYNKVVLYPDGTIDFPEYDIDTDIIAAELGDEPTQQYELYQAYTEHGIFGFALIGKESYFWDGDYYLLDKNPREKRKWAKLLCENLESFLTTDDLLHPDEVDFASKLVKYFSESFEVRVSNYWPEEDIGIDGVNKRQSILCESDILINGNKCLKLTTQVYGTYKDSLPSNRVWSFFVSEHLGDTLWHNTNNLIYGINDMDFEYIENAPEPYNDLDEFNFNPFDGSKKGGWALAIFDNYNDLIFKQTYKTHNDAYLSMEYIYKWFSTEASEALFFHKGNPKAGDFDIFHEIGEDGSIEWGIPVGWLRSGMA